MKCHRILVVDDEHGIRRILQRMLEGEGYTVLTADSVRTAEHLLRNHDADLILCDHQLPGETGLSFLRRCKSTYPRMRRVLISGMVNVNDTVQAINHAQVHYCVLKPFQPDELLAVIRDLIGGPAHRRAAPVRRITVARRHELEQLTAQYPGISDVRRDTRGAVLLDEEYEDFVKDVEQWTAPPPARQKQAEEELALELTEAFDKLVIG